MAAYGAFKNEGIGRGAVGLSTPRAAEKPGAAQGRSATPSYGGYVVSRETNSNLIGTRRYKTFDEMLLNTSIVAASVRYYLNMIARPGWEFDAVDDTAEAKRYAEMTDEGLRGHLSTPWHRVVKRAATYRLYGFHTQEWIARKVESSTGTMIAMTDIQSRMQRTIEKWDVDEVGVVSGIVQRSPHDGHEYYVPRSKLMYLVDDAFDDSPEGLGLFRQAVAAHQYLSRFLQLEAWGYETDLKGMPIVRAPLAWLQREVDEGRMDAEKMEDILAPFKEVLENHTRTPELGVMLDSMVYHSEGEQVMPSSNKMFDFGVVTGEVTANAQQAVSVAIERLNWDIARIFGTETLLLGANGRGANALSKDKTQNLLMVVDGVLLDIAAQVKKDLIEPLFRLNGWPRKYMPRPITDAIVYRDIEDITNALLSMAKAGAVLPPEDPCIPVIRRALGLPRPPEVNRAAEAIIARDEGASLGSVEQSPGQASSEERGGKTRLKAEPRGTKDAAAAGDQQGSPGLGG